MSGRIEHEKGITSNTLSASATGADNAAAMFLASAVDECDPNVDDNCFGVAAMVIEGIDVEVEMEVTQEYEANDGKTAVTVGTVCILRQLARPMLGHWISPYCVLLACSVDCRDAPRKYRGIRGIWTRP